MGCSCVHVGGTCMALGACPCLQMCQGFHSMWAMYMGLYYIYTVYILPVIRGKQQFDTPNRGMSKSHEHVSENETRFI